LVSRLPHSPLLIKQRRQRRISFCITLELQINYQHVRPSQRRIRRKIVVWLIRHRPAPDQDGIAACILQGHPVSVNDAALRYYSSPLPAEMTRKEERRGEERKGEERRGQDRTGKQTFSGRRKETGGVEAEKEGKGG
jgi:PAS domain-containing protein